MHALTHTKQNHETQNNNNNNNKGVVAAVTRSDVHYLHIVCFPFAERGSVLTDPDATHEDRIKAKSALKSPAAYP